MSGQLVGEVLAASDELRGRGLSSRGFYALIAIAEKASTHNRQASVPWKHIRAGLYGASASTAKRAISDLKDAGLVRVLRRGFDNQNGRVEAPIYEIQPIGEQVTQVTQSGGGRTGHLGDPIAADRTGHLEDRTGHFGDRTGHPGDLLNGSTNGSTNGGRARLDDEPRCDKHRDPIVFPRPPKCWDCETVRKEREADQLATAERAAAERKRIVELIDNCPNCDDYGRLDDLTDCPRHPNLRQFRAQAAS